MTNDVKGFQFGSKTYDRLKFAVQIILPAFGVLYATLAGLWGWGHVEQVVGTDTALALFLGVCLRISSSNYDDASNTGTHVGSFVTTTHPDTGAKTVKLELDKDPEEVASGEKLVFTKKDVVPEVNFSEDKDREVNEY